MSEKPASKAAQAKARRQFDKDVARAMSAQTKGTGWRSKYGWPYQERAGWFIHQQHSIYSEQIRTTVSLYAKPIAVDDLFWDIADMAGNKSEASSLRMVGAFSVHTPSLLEADLPEVGGPVEMAGKLVAQARAWAVSFERDAVLESLFARLDRKRWADLPHDPDAVAYTCMLALTGRTTDALEYCHAQISAGSGSGFPNVGKDRSGFYPSAIQWLESSFDPSAYPSF